MAYYAHTRTTTLTTTLTTPYPPARLPLSISFPPPLSPPSSTQQEIHFSTLPFRTSDPLDAKLVPILVVTRWDVKIVDPSGVLLESTHTIMRPAKTLLSVNEKGMEMRAGMGWQSWTGEEKWGVTAAVIGAILMLLAAGCWFIWVKYGKGDGEVDGNKSPANGTKSKNARRRPAVVQTGKTGLLQAFKKTTTNKPTAGQLPAEAAPRQVAGRAMARYEMSGGTEYPQAETSEQGEPGPPESPREWQALNSSYDVAGNRPAQRGEGYGTSQ